MWGVCCKTRLLRSLSLSYQKKNWGRGPANLSFATQTEIRPLQDGRGVFSFHCLLFLFFLFFLRSERLFPQAWFYNMWERPQTDKRTDGRTDTIKRIVSPALQSITMHFLLHASHMAMPSCLYRGCSRVTTLQVVTMCWGISHPLWHHFCILNITIGSTLMSRKNVNAELWVQ